MNLTGLRARTKHTERKQNKKHPVYTHTNTRAHVDMSSSKKKKVWNFAVGRPVVLFVSRIESSRGKACLFLFFFFPSVAQCVGILILLDERCRGSQCKCKEKNHPLLVGRIFTN